jgi:hypothetical protein
MAWMKNLVVVWALVSAPAYAVDAGAHDWLRFVGQMNRPTMAEPAGAHGTIGTTIGLGGEQVPTPEGAAAMAGEELNKAPEAGAPHQLPMAWIVKGTPWPVDFAVSAGAAPDASLKVGAAHAQVTVFEQLGLPAVSLRAAHSRIFGLARTSVATTAADAVVSYGFLRYFSVYGALGAAKSTGAFDGQEESWTEARRTVGLRVMVAPPFVSLTAEAGIDGGQVREAVGKLGVGI